MTVFPRPDMELAERVVGFLNELLKIDPKAMNALVNARVPCDALMDHVSVQVQVTAEGARVGLLGFLNGLVGVHHEGPHVGLGPVLAERFIDRDAIKRFSVLESLDPK